MRRTKRRTVRKKTARTPRVRKGAKAWTATEVTTLRKAYRTQSTTQIAKTLRRTVSSVKAKARTLGLRKPVRRKAAPKKAATKRRVAKRKTTARRKPARKASSRRKTTKRKTPKRR